MSKHNIIAVVPAAGVGTRMQADRPKQYLSLHNKTILEHTIDKLYAHPRVSRVVVAISPNDNFFETLPCAQQNWLTRVDGGKERADSVIACLKTLPPSSWALVHDAARPCVSHKDITALLSLIDSNNSIGGILASPVRDTMKRALKGQSAISHTESRENLWHALTPQLFPTQRLFDALNTALEQGITVTDEASAMEAAGYKVALVDADPANIKITHPADLPLAEFYLQKGEISCE